MWEWQVSYLIIVFILTGSHVLPHHSLSPTSEESSGTVGASRAEEVIIEPGRASLTHSCGDSVVRRNRLNNHQIFISQCSDSSSWSPLLKSSGTMLSDLSNSKYYHQCNLLSSFVTSVLWRTWSMFSPKSKVIMFQSSFLASLSCNAMCLLHRNKDDLFYELLLCLLCLAVCFKKTQICP